MQIILQEDIDKLGHRGDVVVVKPGYARNYLLPRSLAIEATPGNMKALERIRGALAKKTATELDAAKKQVEEQGGKITNEFKLIKGFTYVPQYLPLQLHLLLFPTAVSA